MRRLVGCFLLAALLLTGLGVHPSQAQPGNAPLLTTEPSTQFFPETGKWLSGVFLLYWQDHGGLEIFGYPLSSQLQENGQTVQYFERAVFELNTQNQPPWDVLLRLLGVTVGQKVPDQSPFGRATPLNGTNCRYFAETGHNLCGNFHNYWDRFGSLPVYGYPISEEFQERIAETGKTYTVQYFQRERFELQPGAWPDRLDVLLGRIGAQVLPPGKDAPEMAQIELPDDASRHTLPLHLLVRTPQGHEMLTAQLRWNDGTVLTDTIDTLQGEDKAGVFVGSLNFKNEGRPPMPPTQQATLQITDPTGRIMAQRQLTMVGNDDPNITPVQVFWILEGDNPPYRAVTLRVPRTTAVGTAALEELLWGPAPPNLADFHTAIPSPAEVLSYSGRGADWGPRVTLRKLTIENGVATADFSREMRAYGGGSARVTAITEQITRTLKQFPTVQQVKITIEGQADALQP